jgi:hypothetical protein
MRRIFLLLLLSLGLSIGCGDSKRPANLIESTGGQAGEGGNGGKGGHAGGGVGGDTGGTAGGGTAGTETGGTTVVNQPGAPVVTLVSPASALDPNAAGVITTDTVTVTCKATAASLAGSTVNVNSTTITMSQGTEILDKGPDTSVIVDGARVASFNLQSANSGVITFNCQATDSSATPRTGVANPLKLLVDRGPKIKITEPKESSFISKTNAVKFVFTLEDSRIATGDEKSGITKISATVNERPVIVTETPSGSGNYEGQIPLNDRVPFPDSNDPFTTAKLTVVAENARSVITEANRTFKVDGSAPIITFVEPTSPVIIGNNVTITFSVDDDGSGVVPETVTVFLGNSASYSFTTDQPDMWAHKVDSTFSFTFNAAEVLGTALTEIFVAVTAGDVAGNTNTNGASILLYLDQRAPKISLDPPTVRDRHATSTGNLVCSNAFDPLGEAMNDRSIVTNADYYRAFVWDETNSAREGLPQYFSLTDPNRVWLYVHDNVSKSVQRVIETSPTINPSSILTTFETRLTDDTPLLVDTDSDGICDDIAASPNVPPIQIKPVLPRGNAPWKSEPDEIAFTANDDTRFFTPSPPLTGCSYQGWDQSESSFLCDKTSDMVRVVQHEIAGTTPEPVVYGIEPAVSPFVECTGRYLELAGLFRVGKIDAANHMIVTEDTEGWHCLAVKAIDNVGNRGVSPPLRVCYDDPRTTFKPTCATLVDPTQPSRSTDPNYPSCTLKCALRVQTFDRLLDNQKNH